MKRSNKGMEVEREQDKEVDQAAGAGGKRVKENDPHDVVPQMLPEIKYECK